MKNKLSLSLMLDNVVFIENKKYHPKLKDIPMLIKGYEERSNEFIYRLFGGDINPPNFLTSAIEYSQLLKYIKPIKIHPKYLMRLEGFKEIKIGHDGIVYSIFINNDTRLFYDDFDLKGVGILHVKTGIVIKLKHIKYIHEIQNLYLLLSGEKLIFK